MPLVQQLIKKQTRHWDSKLVSDPVQEKLLEIIEAQRKKTTPAKAKASEPEATPTNVVNIMDALRRSVEAEKSTGQALIRPGQTAEIIVGSFNLLDKGLIELP